MSVFVFLCQRVCHCLSVSLCVRVCVAVLGLHISGCVRDCVSVSLGTWVRVLGIPVCLCVMMSNCLCGCVSVCLSLCVSSGLGGCMFGSVTV